MQMNGRNATDHEVRSQARAGRCAALLWTLALAAIVGWPPTARTKDDFLAPEQAYRYLARMDGSQLIVSWRIEPGYYLYRKRLAVASSASTAQLGTPAWPKGENHHDEYFGDQEIYRDRMEVAVPVSFSGARPAQLPIELKLQGCADAGLCYPPMVWKTQVALAPMAPAVPAALTAPNGLKSFFNAPGTSNQDDFLPPDQAFRFSAQMDRADVISLNWVIAEGYYLYRQRISASSDTPDVQLGTLVLPKGQMKHDESFGDSEVYHQLLDASLPVARAAGSGGTLSLNVTYQGCAEGGLCYNPITKTVSVEMPSTDVATTLPAAMPATAGTTPNSGAPVAEQDRLAAALQGTNLPYALLLFFGAGLLLSLTPCVLPMIPILSGIIVGQGESVTRKRSFALAFTYVQGMALTYAAAGAIFVVAFKQAPQAFFQQPWIIMLMVLLFVALAFAMFGAYTLQLPSTLQTRLNDASNKQKSGTYVGTFIMGALSALVVTACVAPAIIAALSVISQTRQIFRGALALYATGLGMGVPLLVVGASAGTLLPKAGPWMDTVKQLFGVLFMGVAIYLAQPLLPDSLAMLLWSALAVLSGFWIFALKTRSGGPAPAVLRAAGLLILIYGVLVLIGAASGSRDPLQPLDNLRAGSGGTTVAAKEPALAFRRIKSVADLDVQVAAAKAAGRPVMLDFYADWCVSCKEMEKYTFTDAAVRAALANAVLLQADVTANDDLDRALLARFAIFGPPTIAFFGTDGIERQNFRLVGFTPAERFHQHVTSAFTS